MQNKLILIAIEKYTKYSNDPPLADILTISFTVALIKLVFSGAMLLIAMIFFHL